MTSEPDLREAIQTAFAHCRPGGIAVLVPDYTAETFEESSDHGGTDGRDGRGFATWIGPGIQIPPTPGSRPDAARAVHRSPARPRGHLARRASAGVMTYRCRPGWPRCHAGYPRPS